MRERVIKGTAQERLVVPPVARERGCGEDNGVNVKERRIERVKKARYRKTTKHDTAEKTGIGEYVGEGGVNQRHRGSPDDRLRRWKAQSSEVCASVKGFLCTPPDQSPDLLLVTCRERMDVSNRILAVCPKSRGSREWITVAYLQSRSALPWQRQR